MSCMQQIMFLIPLRLHPSLFSTKCLGNNGCYPCMYSYFLQFKFVHVLHFQFVAHPYCQIMVRKLWHLGIPDCGKKFMHNYKITFQLLYGLMWMLLLPFACLSYFFGIWPYLNKQMEHPINKFANKAISLICFLVLLVLNQALYGKNGKYYTANEPETFNIVEILIIVMIADFSFAHLMMFKRKCLRKKFEILFLLCFWIWIILHVCSINMKPNHNLIFSADCFMAVGIILAFSKVSFENFIFFIF